METQTQTYITSQGEIVRTEKEAPTGDKEIKIEEKKILETHTTQPGVLNELWHTVKDNAVAAAHVAEMAAVIAGEAALEAKEATSGLLEKGIERAQEASEKIAEKTNELVAGLHLSDTSKAPTKPASIQLEQLAEIIIEQAKESAAKATAAASQAKEAIVEAIQTSDVTQVVQDTLSSAAQTAQEAARGVVETAQEKVFEAAPITAPAAEQPTTQQAGQTQAPTQTLPRVRSFKRTGSKQAANVEPPQGWQQTLTLTMDVVSHIQRIADRTGDALLHETARRAHSACAKGLSEAPGVHLTWVTPQQANDLVNLAIRTQDHELADFARYCQSVAATSHIAVEPTPGKIQEEILKGFQELQQQGRIHTGPGYGAAFASVNKSYVAGDSEGPVAPPSSPVSTISQQAQLGTLQQQQPALQQQPLQKKPLSRQSSWNQQQLQKPDLVLNMDVVSHIQRIADRTGNSVLHETARKAHSACAKGLNDAPGVHLTWITPQQASELMNLASRTTDQELVDFARYCQSVAATTQVGVEPVPGKIQEEIFKGRMEIQLNQAQQSQQAGGGAS